MICRNCGRDINAIGQDNMSRDALQTIAEARAWATGDLIPADVVGVMDVLATMLANEFAARRGTP